MLVPAHSHRRRRKLSIRLGERCASRITDTVKQLAAAEADHVARVPYAAIPTQAQASKR